MYWSPEETVQVKRPLFAETQLSPPAAVDLTLATNRCFRLRSVSVDYILSAIPLGLKPRVERQETLQRYRSMLRATLEDISITIFYQVFQRRKDGSVDFYRNWTEYVNGFGDKNGEFWLGLEAIHNLTKNGDTMLRIDMRERNGQYMFAEYSSFMIESASTNYTLNVSGYSGNATDAFGDPPLSEAAILNGHPFSTYDADNDQYSGNCAEISSGGWWYNKCQYSNLNGLYHGTSSFKIMRWVHQYDRRDMVMQFTEMKIRPKLPLEA